MTLPQISTSWSVALFPCPKVSGIQQQRASLQGVQLHLVPIGSDILVHPRENSTLKGQSACLDAQRVWGEAR